MLASGTSLTVESCRFEGNKTAGRGGAIHSDAPLTVRDSTFVGNGVFGTGGQSAGGAVVLYDPSSLLLDRCTLVNNTASVHGGAVMNWKLTTAVNSQFRGNGLVLTETGRAIASVGPLKLVHVTLTDNRALAGAAVMVGAALTAQNTVLAGGGSGPLCGGATLSGTDVWVEDGTCGATANGDPLLEPPDTSADGWVAQVPAVGSPLLDSGNPAACGPGALAPVDLRGQARPTGGCDIGAVERRPSDCALPAVSLSDGRCVRTDSAGLRIAVTDVLLANLTRLHIVPPTTLLHNGGAETFTFEGWSPTTDGDGWGFQNGMGPDPLERRPSPNISNLCVSRMIRRGAYVLTFAVPTSKHQNEAPHAQLANNHHQHAAAFLRSRRQVHGNQVQFDSRRHVGPVCRSRRRFAAQARV